MQRIVLVLLAFAVAAPAAAQEWLVNRDRFRYIGTRLTIEVVAEAAGTLQIIRGQNGWLGVAGRAPAGIAASGLSDDHRLTLSAAGQGPVHYTVSVPEGVWIVVRLPDRARSESLGSYDRLGTFDWAAAAAPARAAAAPPYVLPDEDVSAGLFTTYSADLAPETVALPDLRAVRAVTVRTGATRFRIATSRPLSLEAGSPARFEIRPSGEPMDIVIEIPAGTPAFGLSAGGVPALLIDEAAVLPRCGPLTRQWLSGGRQWVTFTPVDGRLDCEPAPTTRHKG